MFGVNTLISSGLYRQRDKDRRPRAVRCRSRRSSLIFSRRPVRRSACRPWCWCRTHPPLPRSQATRKNLSLTWSTPAVARTGRLGPVHLYRLRKRHHRQSVTTMACSMRFRMRSPANLAPILTLSYGGCEAEDATYAISTLEPLLRAGKLPGSNGSWSHLATRVQPVARPATIAKTATAGLSVSYPASSAYVTAVGGTQLNSDSSTYWSSSNNSSLGSAHRLHP